MTQVSARPSGPAMAITGVRLLLVTFAAPLVAIAGGGVAAWSTVKSLRRGLRARPLAVPALLGAAAAAYARFIQPWMAHWGSRPEEREMELPGDELVPDPFMVSTRAITIEAPPEAVWPWLAQIGQDRGGFYSYERLENLAGCNIRNADQIHPEWQHREVGDTVYLHPLSGLQVERFEPGQVLVLRQWGAFVILPDGEGRSRLLARTRVPRGIGALYYLLFVEFPHFVMERKMLLGIRDRAEAAWQSRDAGTAAPEETAR